MKLYDSHEEALVAFSSEELREYCEEDNQYANSLDCYRYTPLISACALQLPAQVKALLDAGADPNFTADDGETPLKAAVPPPGNRWSRDIYRYLFDHGANPNTGLEPPLHLAILRGHRELVAYMLERGADPNLEDVDWDTPLSASTSASSESEEIKRLLTRHGAKPRPWEKS